jgi:hypothetical protein
VIFMEFIFLGIWRSLLTGTDAGSDIQPRVAAHLPYGSFL